MPPIILLHSTVGLSRLADNGIETCRRFDVDTGDNNIFFKRLKAQKMTDYRPELGVVMRGRIDYKLAGCDFAEFSKVRLTTDAYAGLGLKRGETGTVVDVMDFPRSGYTVEFHDLPPSHREKVKTMEADEIEAVVE